jgi:hypothetical protein
MADHQAEARDSRRYRWGIVMFVIIVGLTLGAGIMWLMG